MELSDYIEGGGLITITGGIAYAVNKWLIPAYKGLKKEIEVLRQELKKEIELRIKLEVSLATLKERYAEKTVLKSGRKDRKK
jgi:hypothetical protein